MVAYQAGKAAKITAPADDQPHLVAVPGRADGVDEDAPLQVVATEEGVQHADAEVEPFEHEEADPEDGVDDEPEISECHDGLLVDERRLVLVGRFGADR